MVYHYAAAGTVDHTEEYFPTVNDWVPVRRRRAADGAGGGVTASSRWAVRGR